MISIDVRSNLAQIEKKLSSFAFQQMPFAAAQALTEIAKKVMAAEQANEVQVLDRPKPFTLGGIGVVRADKRSQTATVFMKDTTAKYLEPYEFGGENILNGRALLKPIDAVKDLDQYGNLPRGFLKKMKGRSDVFIGPVQTKRGIVNGVWQRVTEVGGAAKVTRSKGGVLKVGKTRKSLNTSGHLKLLVRFTDAHEVRQHLDWFGVAKRVVSKEFDREFGRALARAMASGKR